MDLGQLKISSVSAWMVPVSFYPLLLEETCKFLHSYVADSSAAKLFLHDSLVSPLKILCYADALRYLY